jgi:hypothetical protein
MLWNRLLTSCLRFRAFSITIALTCLCGTSAMSGGDSGPGLLKNSLTSKAVNKAKSSMIGAYTSSGFGATATFFGYPELGIEKDTDRAHKVSAYLWGHMIADPEIAGLLRLGGEATQFVYYGNIQIAAERFNRISPYDIEVKYKPISLNGPGGLRDSKSDIEISMQGAKDAQNGVFNLPK